MIFLLRHPAAFMRTRRASALQSRTYVLKLLMKGRDASYTRIKKRTDSHSCKHDGLSALSFCVVMHSWIVSKKIQYLAEKVLKNAVPSDILKKL